MKEKIYDFGILGKWSKTTILNIKRIVTPRYSIYVKEFRIDAIEDKYKKKKYYLDTNLKELNNFVVNKGILSKDVSIKLIRDKIQKIDKLERKLEKLNEDYSKYTKTMRTLAEPLNVSDRKRAELRREYWKKLRRLSE